MIYSFEDFELDIDLVQLRRAGAAVPIQPQMFDVLRHLIEHRHRVVPKEELLDTVWGDRFVSESALSSRIKAIRRVLGDNGAKQAVIRTVHGRGFQFLPSVSASAGSPVSAPPHRSVFSVPASRFFGRDADVDGVTRLLSERRLVTIWGTGGVGKTRLAMQVASGLADEYPDGIHFVELAPMTPGDDLARRIGAQLGVGEREGHDPAARLVEAFAGHRALIVLDNCEHLADPIRPIVHGVVVNTSAVDVLATSRRPLGLDGEQLWALAPLALRVPESTGISPAAEMFVDRVRTSSPGLDLAGSRDQIEAICQRLDGVPLLLELAAARTRHIGVHAVLEATGQPDVLNRLDGLGGRHGSVEAVIRWSYDLLDDEQQAVFRALSIFPSWFDLDGATAVAGADARMTLWQLTDQSLITADVSAARPRYRVLEPVREFARRQCRGDELDGRRLDHARFVVGAIAEADRMLRGPTGVEGMRRLDRLGTDVIAACECLREAGCADDLATAARSLFVFALEGIRSDIHRLFEAASRRGGAAAEAAIVPASAAVGAWQRGDLVVARQLVDQALELAGHDDASRAFVCLVEGQLLQLAGRREEAVAAGLRALACDPDPIITVKALAVCALNSPRAGGGADGYARRMCETAEVSASPLASAWSAFVLGELAMEDAPERALDRLATASALARDAGSPLLGGAAALSSISLRCRLTSGSDTSLREFAPLLHHWQRLGMWAHQWATLRNLVVVLSATPRSEAAATLYGAATSPRAGVSAHGAEAERLHAAIETVQRQLGTERCAQLVERGRVMPPAEAVALALDTVHDRPGPGAGA